MTALDGWWATDLGFGGVHHHAPRLGRSHKAKVKLGPTGSFGRDALRRVLARNQPSVPPSPVARGVAPYRPTITVRLRPRQRWSP